jgi:hypothetical protein
LIEIKIKKFPPEVLKRQILYLWWKREVNETDLEALREKKRRIKRRS